MDNTKIGNKEAIALLVTIVFNQIILSITKTILDDTSSSSLLNILYIGIITLIFGCAVCYFLNKFPTFDLIDISNYLGGNLLKWIVGLLYIAYFILFTGVLLHMFSSCLRIIYFPHTDVKYIILMFIIAALFACSIKHNSIFRSNLIFFPLAIISIVFLFLSDIPFYSVEKIYPIFGNGIFETFVGGLSNMFAFQCLAYIYILPPMLKNPEKIKNITITSIILSCLLLFLSTAILLFLFDGFVDTDELMPLYSAVKYIEFGSFFRKLDSLFVLIWIISFVSYLSITLKFSSNIMKKLTNVTNSAPFTYLLAIILFLCSIWPKNYAVSISFCKTAYKTSFFVLIIGISFFILLFSIIKLKVRKWFTK